MVSESRGRIGKSRVEGSSFGGRELKRVQDDILRRRPAGVWRCLAPAGRANGGRPAVSVAAASVGRVLPTHERRSSAAEAAGHPSDVDSVLEFGIGSLKYAAQD